MTALTASGGYRAPAASSIDRAIRLSTAAAVLAVAGIAAYVSYWHAYAVVRAHSESAITARLEPATIDGLVYASSMVILYAARHRAPVPRLARWLLGLGIAATLTANMAQGWSHGPVGAVVAAWPAASLAGSYELLVWLIRTARALERQPSTACRDVARSAPAAAIEGEQHSGNDRDQSGQGWQPAIPASGQHGDGALEADADNYAAVAAYRLSAKSRQSALRTQARQDVRTHLPPLGTCQDRRCAAITVRIQPSRACCPGFSFRQHDAIDTRCRRMIPATKVRVLSDSGSAAR
jgi:hypothetical protein